MGVDVMRPAYNFETKVQGYYIVKRTVKQGTQDCTHSSGAHQIYRWLQDGGGGGTSLQEEGTYATVFQAEINATLACAYEIHVDIRPEKYVTTCSDSQAALKAIQAAKTTSQLVQQCQKALNDISTQHSVGLFRVPDILGHKEMKLPMSSQGNCSPVCWTGTNRVGRNGRM
jgi:hypothetical protein